MIYSIQWIGPRKYGKNRKTFVPKVLKKISIVFKQRGKWLVIIQVIPGWGYLYYHPENITHKVCYVLTNNVNLKGLFDRYMCVWQRSAFSCPSISLLFFSLNYVCTILKLISYRKIFLTIYNMTGPVSIYFLSKQFQIYVL